MEDSRQTIDIRIPFEMSSALISFKTEALNIVKRTLSTLDQDQLPPMIYHYTTESGLEGILKSGRFWLTNIFSLNDPSELRHGINIALKVLEGKKQRQSFRPVHKFAEHFKSVMQSKKLHPCHAWF